MGSVAQDPNSMLQPCCYVVMDCQSGYSAVVGKDCILVITIAAHNTLVLDSPRFVRPSDILRLTSACGHRECNMDSTYIHLHLLDMIQLHQDHIMH